MGFEDCRDPRWKGEEGRSSWSNDALELFSRISVQTWDKGDEQFTDNTTNSFLLRIFALCNFGVSFLLFSMVNAE